MCGVRIDLSESRAEAVSLSDWTRRVECGDAGIHALHVYGTPHLKEGHHMIALLLVAQLTTPNVDLAVALKTVQTAAMEFSKTPFCYTAPEAPKPTCQPALPAKDLAFVKQTVSAALKAMTKEDPTQQRVEASKAAALLRQRLGSSGYQRLFPFINTLEVTVSNLSPPVEPKRDAAGNPIKDDQP